ncbi:MAG TPA: NAD(P)/FAD-dependent oxidoreductase [Vicinamibacteria bacterium]|nr:NAD(P)/FAD-dependent oxidoreductase [Vicinamibacteria bacterium]
MKILIAGAGVMGLAAALDLLEDGHDVEVFEAADRPGGLAGSFDFGSVKAEKFYHFLCGGDRVYFRWLHRLGLAGRLRWRRTGMAVFRDGRLRPFGDPLSLLRFSPLSLASRVRYGMHVLSAKRRSEWGELENVSARNWLVEGAGEEAYRVVWEPLLRQKFGEETDSISAAWIWSRIHRLASSRNRVFQEHLGFLEGGSDAFVDALAAAVSAKGGRIRCASPIEKVYIEDSRARGLRASGRDHAADAVVSTIPLSFLLRIAPGLPQDYRDKAKDLGNVGVRCIVLKLRKPLTPYFWINVNDDLPVCGLIEYTNLNPPASFEGRTLLYSPLYVPASEPRYRSPSGEVLEETLDGIARIVPGFDRSDVLDHRVFREPFAQPICPVGFTARLAPLRTPVENLVAADTTHLLPHDRSISDSLALAGRLLGALRESFASGTR